MGLAWELLVAVCHLTLDLNLGPKLVGRMGKPSVCVRFYSLVNRKILPSLQKTVVVVVVFSHPGG